MDANYRICLTTSRVLLKGHSNIIKTLSGCLYIFMRLLYKIWLLNSPAYKRRVSSSIALEYFNSYLRSLKWTTTFWPKSHTIYDTSIIWLKAYHKGRFDYTPNSLHIFHKSVVSRAGSTPVFSFSSHFCLNCYFHPNRKITHPLQPWAILGGKTMETDATSVFRK